ncbi:hypothetical protein [Kribbella soli]|uniref:Uncharacterized protein n=1 Tax=Kribbella soli TaxID=1124743 RepID=A0A4R0HCL1_9ACTN|nr:hypothetical protein [Kribbella soli]TCC07963.1 hypothetical protein E0H45_18700 [Kribbella soli]
MTSWREERRQAAVEHAAALERKKAAESAQARQLLAGFIETLKERGVEPEPLRAQVIGSNASYRTDLTGWYLRRNRSLAVDVDGNFYILGVPASLKSRVAGVRVLPSDPPLVVGQGARDGESMPLAELLRLRLES